MPRFQKGQSGNPAGRKPGSGYATKIRDAIEKELPEIVEALVLSAKEGDSQAAKLLLDRAIPAFKPTQKPVRVEGLGGKSLTEQGMAVIEAMGDGKLSPEQTQAVLTALTNLSKIIESDEIERRIAALEQRQK